MLNRAPSRRRKREGRGRGGGGGDDRSGGRGVGVFPVVPHYLQLHLHLLRVSRVDERPLDHEANEAAKAVRLDVHAARRQRVDPVPPGLGLGLELQGSTALG